jgi:hypothetical protein
MMQFADDQSDVIAALRWLLARIEGGIADHV